MIGFPGNTLRVGDPIFIRTRITAFREWLIKRGARHEKNFKYFQRRHQIPSQVWYKAYPGLTLTDLARNQRIREGLERASMSDAQALAWLRLL